MQSVLRFATYPSNEWHQLTACRLYGQHLKDPLYATIVVTHTCSEVAVLMMVRIICTLLRCFKV